MGSAYLAGAVSVGDFSTVGSNATIFPGVSIGNNCFVGAGSVVRKDIPDNSMVIGNPSRFLKSSRTLPNPVNVTI